MSSGKLAAELDDAATARGGLGGALGLSFRSHGAARWRGQSVRAAYGAHYINARSSMICKGVDGAGKRQAKGVRQVEFAADVLFPLDRRKANSEQVKSKWRANKKQI